MAEGAPAPRLSGVGSLRCSLSVAAADLVPARRVWVCERLALPQPREHLQLLAGACPLQSRLHRQQRPALVFSSFDECCTPLRSALRSPRPANLATGEYRSRLLFAEQDDVISRDRAASAAAASGEIGVTLTALVGVSIPVIVRHGATSAEVVLGSLALGTSPDGRTPALSLRMRRAGSQSVHGDLEVSFVPAGGGAAVVVGRAGGVAVYTPNLVRAARLPLVVPAGTTLAGGTLHVSYREPPERGGALLAEASLPLP